MRKRSAVGKYCSTTCRDIHSPGRTPNPENTLTKICPGCNETFTCPRSKETEYCSRVCRTRHSGTRITTTCPACRKSFQYYRSWPRTHCSQECYGASKDKGGKVYYGGNWAVQRSLAIVRDGGQCVDCNGTADLHVHHLVAVREFNGDWRAANELGNLVTVCPPCHLSRHGGAY